MRLFSSLLVVLSVLVPRAFAQPVYRFEVEVPAVYVDVFVTRDGKSVAGLTADHFEVLDSGVRQEVRIVDLESVPLSVMMVLDSSGSVLGEKLTNLKAGAVAFIAGLREVDEAGLVAFSEGARLLQGPTQDWAALSRSVNRLAPGGPTALYDAVYVGLKLVEERGSRPLIIVFTDGMDNASWLSAAEVLEAVKASDAVINVIVVRSSAGVRLRNLNTPSESFSRSLPRPAWSSPQPEERDRSEGFLKALAKASGGRLWYAESPTGLEAVYLDILQEMGSRYLLSYEPTGVPGEGWHTLEVKLKGAKADDVRARSGYRVTSKDPAR